MITPEKWFQRLEQVMEALEVTAVDGSQFGLSAGFEQLLMRTEEASSEGQHFFFIGNGASASMASHIAADLCKNGHLKTEVFTDLALLTALVNDLGVERMFEEPLRQQAVEDDILMAISSSGNSVNLLRAVETAREFGLYVVTLTAMEPSNALRKAGDLNFYVPAPTYGFAESAHAAILHYWVDWALERLVVS